MGTLSERPADAVACGSISADEIVDAQRSSRSALHFTHTDPFIRESLIGSPAIGAEHLRDGAMVAAPL